MFYRSFSFKYEQKSCIFLLCLEYCIPTQMLWTTVVSEMTTAPDEEDGSSDIVVLPGDMEFSACPLDGSWQQPSCAAWHM